MLFELGPPDKTTFLLRLILPLKVAVVELFIPIVAEILLPATVISRAIVISPVAYKATKFVGTVVAPMLIALVAFPNALAVLTVMVP